jgi:ribosomal protein S12 methylthiotransferase
MEEPIKFCVVSLGCSKNLVDTELMCGALANAGFAITNVADFADVMIVNTCCFIEDARSESREAIKEALVWKCEGGTGKGRRVVVAGCWPQRDAAVLCCEFPGVDLFCGIEAAARLPELVGGLFSAAEDESAGRVEVSDAPRSLPKDDAPRLLLTPTSFAYVKVADGCDNCCSYCAIPLIRGGFRSRSMDSILAEAEGLLENGVCELNLVAQDTTNYGSDLGKGENLARLLDELGGFGGDYWVRVLYSHPRHLTEAVLERMAGDDHTVPYIDLPLQHISGRILERMGRGLGEDETRRLLERIRSEYPGIAVRTTFLVGFPGESESDFEKLERLVVEYEFEHVGVFTYSREPGTAAFSSKDSPVAMAVMEERLGRLMELQREIALRRNRSRVGGEFRVLVDGVADEVESAEDGAIYWRGRTAVQAPDVDDCVFFTAARGDGVPAGFVRVSVEDAGAYELWGHELENMGVTE